MTLKHMYFLKYPAIALLLIGCSDFEVSNKDDQSFNENAEPGDYDTGYSEDDDADWEGEEPEVEDDFLALAPSQTDVYVFIANPGRSTVTRVNVFTQEVRTTEVGLDPSIVNVTPDYTTAAVFNNGSDSVSIVDAASLDVLEVEVRDNFNQMKMSPQGGWVGLPSPRNDLKIKLKIDETPIPNLREPTTSLL